MKQWRVVFSALLLGLVNGVPAGPVEVASLINELAASGCGGSDKAFASDSEFFVRVTIAAAQGTFENFYAGQWRPQGIREKRGAAIFQTWRLSPDQRLFSVEWRQYEPIPDWGAFDAWIRDPDLHAFLGRSRRDEGPTVQDGATVSIEVRYRKTHVRSVIRNPLSREPELETHLRRIEGIFGFRFRSL